MADIFSFLKEALGQTELSGLFLFAFITLGMLFKDFITVARVLRTILYAFAVALIIIKSFAL